MPGPTISPPFLFTDLGRIEGQEDGTVDLREETKNFPTFPKVSAARDEIRLRIDAAGSSLFHAL